MVVPKMEEGLLSGNCFLLETSGQSAGPPVHWKVAGKVQNEQEE